ncbi:MAG: VanW family protein [Chloroflexota bacterium]
MSLSGIHPLVYEARVAQLRATRRIRDRLDGVPFARRQLAADLSWVGVRHRSLLRRRLGTSDPALQEAKVVNLLLAVRGLDRLVIAPGEAFSFWERVGAPSAERGFVDGLVLVAGEVATGTGGGLCQLANLLYWMALHAPLEIVEHHHHGFDPFPDDGRVLPFGSGASVFYSYVDLRVRNATDRPIEVRTWVGATDLHGELRSDRPWPHAYHIEERAHRFTRDAGGRVRRRNELWRRTVDRRTGETTAIEAVTVNDSLVKYSVPEELISGSET